MTKHGKASNGNSSTDATCFERCCTLKIIKGSFADTFSKPGKSGENLRFAASFVTGVLTHQWHSYIMLKLTMCSKIRVWTWWHAANAVCVLFGWYDRYGTELAGSQVRFQQVLERCNERNSDAPEGHYWKTELSRKYIGNKLRQNNVM